MQDEADRGRREKVGVIIVHGVGEAEPGWTNDVVIPALMSEADGGLVLEPHSEIHRLDDNRTPRQSRAREQGQPSATPRRRDRPTFEANLRHGHSRGGVDVTFAELHWADLSKSGDSTLSRTWALTRLFFEAPQVLAREFLRESTNFGLQWVINQLVLFSAWLVRFPISGVYLSGFLAAIAVIIWQRVPFFFYDESLLPYGIIAFLTAISLGAWRVFYNQSHRNLGLSDLGLGVCISAAVMAICIAAVAASGITTQLGDTKYYLAGAVGLVMLGWLVWTYSVLVALCLLGISGLVRLVYRGRKGSWIVKRSATGLGLIVLQSIIWKIVVGLFTIPAMALLAPDFTENAAVICQLKEQTVSTQCQVFRAYEVLTFVFTISMLSLAAVALAYLLVVAARVGIRRIFAKRAQRGEMVPPRMLVSIVILATLFAAFLFNYWVLYSDEQQLQQAGELIEGQPRAPMIVLDSYRRSILDWLREVFLIYATSGFAGLLLALHLLNGLQSASTGLIHIGRDIVDHRYRFERRSRLAMMNLPTASKPQSRYPRRQRIQSRLKQIVERLLLPGNFDRIVFVAHSQGSVIVYDYLRDSHDDEVVADNLNRIRRIDVVTVGSPLSHIYQHYFEEYEAGVPGAERLNPRLETWVNLWRIDDPIGQRVDIVAGGFIENVPLAAGGHTAYWADRTVAQRILRAIDPSLAKPIAKSRPAAEQRAAKQATPPVAS